MPTLEEFLNTASTPGTSAGSAPPNNQTDPSQNNIDQAGFNEAADALMDLFDDE